MNIQECACRLKSMDMCMFACLAGHMNTNKNEATRFVVI